MVGNLWKVVIATGLIAAPAGLGIAAYAGELPLPALSRGAQLREGPQGEILEDFTAVFDEPLTTGTLDLRIDEGAVHVYGWDQNAYNVQVLAAQGTSEGLSDHQTVIQFDDASSGNDLKLTLTVDQQSTYDISATGSARPELAIVAFVPRAVAYDSVFACSGEAPALAFGPVDPWPFDDPSADVEIDCISYDGTLRPSFGMALGDSDRPRLNVSFGADDLHGTSITLATEYGDVGASRLAFETATLFAEYGGLTATEFAVGGLTALTEYGDIYVEGALANAQARTEYGEVVFDLTAPARDGAIDARSDYGDVMVHVAQAPSVGYLANAGTDYGEIVLAFADADVQENDRDADRDWTDPMQWFTEEDGYEHQATATTHKFEAAAVQFSIGAFTRYGNVLVSDGTPIKLIDQDKDDDRPRPSPVPTEFVLSAL